VVHLPRSGRQMPIYANAGIKQRKENEIKIIFLFFGSSALEGSVFEWVADHRNHHQYTDTDRDPYNAKRGFYYTHVGWLFDRNLPKRDFDNIEDLKKDPLLHWQHKHYMKIAVIAGYIVPMIIATLWSDPLGGLYIVGSLRITLNQHSTFCVNSICHMFGKKNYLQETTARDHFISAVITLGEGYHNFHHKFPNDYRNGVRFYDFDPSKWLIRTLSFIGLTSSLVVTSKKRIRACREEVRKSKP